MKIKIIQILVLIIGISLFVLSACSRERIDSLDDLNVYKPIDDYLETKKQEEQEFIVTEESTNPIVGNQDSKIWISKDLLMFPDSSDVEWPFTVRLVELYTPKDMIYYQMPTVENGNILETEGEVRIRAFKLDENNVEQELLLKPNKTYALEMPSDSVRSNLKVFYGKEGEAFVDWTTDVVSLGGNTADDFFTATSTGHKANIGKLGWINCGRSHQGVYNITFSSVTDHLDYIGIFTYSTEYKSIIQAYNQTTAEMPDALDVKIIAIGINSSDELFYSYIETKMSATKSININLDPISDQELSSILNDL